MAFGDTQSRVTVAADSPGFVAFDLDGTLTSNTSELQKQAFEQTVFNDCINRGMSEESAAQAAKETTQAYFAAYGGSAPLKFCEDKNLNTEQRENFIATINDITWDLLEKEIAEQGLPENIQELKQKLIALSEQGYTLAVFSNSNSVFVKRVLEAYGLLECFSEELVMGVDDAGYIGKTQPEGYDYLLRRLSFENEETPRYMVEDSISNLHPAAERNFTNVMINPAQHEQAQEAGYECHDDVTAFIDSLLAKQRGLGEG